MRINWLIVEDTDVICDVNGVVHLDSTKKCRRAAVRRIPSQEVREAVSDEFLIQGSNVCLAHSELMEAYLRDR